jgi:hypothetical protein
VIVTPKAVGAAEAALRIMARRGRGEWMALMVEREGDVASVADELADEMDAIGDGTAARIGDAKNADDLATHLAATKAPAVAFGLDGWPAQEWEHFDRVRSRFARDERTVLVVSRSVLNRILLVAPNFSSWLGASVFGYLPDASVLTEEERERRLEALREQSGMSDDEVLAKAEARRLPADPEYAEWLVLLRRGDLLER